VLERTATAQALQLEEQITELSGTASRLRRSQHELRRREARLREDTGIAEALHMVGTDLSAELDVERVVQRATDVATRLTGAAFGSFFYNVTDDLGESYLLYTLSGVPREAFAKFPMPRNTRIFDPTFRGTSIVRSDDITQDPRYGKNPPYRGIPAGHLPVVSYLAVPAVSPTGETIGGFFFAHPRPGRFTERHERLAIGVAAHAAVALDNARLYRRERTAAVELQRSLLPSIQEHGGLELRSRYLPAAKGTEVGGDWMDLVPLSAGRVALVIGDVMGKGIRAAAIMGQLRTAIRAYASLDLPPGQLMRQLNASINTEMATCLYVVLDLVHQRLVYANAGHLPLAVISDDGYARLLDRVVGPPLGTWEYPYTEGTAPLPAGQSLLLYTDGLVERRDVGIDKRLNALLDSLAERTRPTDESVDGLIDDLVDRSQHDDDIALLYVRQPPSAIPLTARRTFEATTLSSRDARLFAEQTARTWAIPALVIDAIVAIVAELVANATLHARTPVVELRLHRLPGTFAVEVFDQDNRLPFLIESTFDDEHHRGLQIVRASAARWGTRAVPDGKVVWAELSV
jgi:serine phosphatase RsbU (regulator of sigma subunit)